jgi:hypothetical protein
MLTEFDQTTIANMTAALDFICKKIPADKDTNELRKRIGDELVRCARMGRRSLIDLQQAGMKMMEETATPTRWVRMEVASVESFRALRLQPSSTGRRMALRSSTLVPHDIHCKGDRHRSDDAN